MNNTKPKLNRITVTDEDHVFRNMCDDIAQWVHEKNPYNFAPHHRSQFRPRSGVRIGNSIKLAIEQLHKQVIK